MHSGVTIWQDGEFRIQRYMDEDCTAAELFGDDDTPIEERYRLMNMYGVYGFALEKWNPAVGVGWAEENSCWGFLGEKDLNGNEHYIVAELKQHATR